jgi:alkylation response protein AidB-like acyl-CoA dehydrogenase
VVDCTAQIYGGKGVIDDFVLASELVELHLLQIASGQDAVHRQIVAATHGNQESQTGFGTVQSIVNKMIGARLEGS